MQGSCDTIVLADLLSSQDLISFCWIVETWLLLCRAYYEVVTSVEQKQNIESKLLIEVQAIKWRCPCFIYVNKHKDLWCLPSEANFDSSISAFNFDSSILTSLILILQFWTFYHLWMLHFWPLSFPALLDLMIHKRPWYSFLITDVLAVGQSE